MDIPMTTPEPADGAERKLDHPVFGLGIAICLHFVGWVLLGMVPAFDVDVVIVCFGLIQVLWLGPAWKYARALDRNRTAHGIVIAALLTLAASVGLFVIALPWFLWEGP